MADGDPVPIYCSCHDGPHRERLATVRDGQIVISDRRHGTTHQVSIPVADVDVHPPTYARLPEDY